MSASGEIDARFFHWFGRAPPSAVYEVANRVAIELHSITNEALQESVREGCS